jgi:L-ascorbate metabolism protein UlaG (beta-lactamase superfamily)
MSELVLSSGATPADLGSGSIFFIGNATVLIRYAGFTILADPTFIHMHEQVSIGYGMHSTRLTNPAMEIHDLPKLDLVLLLHFHGDHFDHVAERELDKTGGNAPGEGGAETGRSCADDNDVKVVACPFP